MDINTQLDTLAESINNYNDSIQQAVQAGENLLNEVYDNEDTFYTAAQYIVEPEGIEDDYYDFADTDPENWAGFIRSHFGEDWGRIAEIVNEYGY
jgi:hypothetical protein